MKLKVLLEFQVRSTKIIINMVIRSYDMGFVLGIHRF
jgi:hypothetical protein